jgi:hypothetical protein
MMPGGTRWAARHASGTVLGRAAIVGGMSGTAAPLERRLVAQAIGRHSPTLPEIRDRVFRHDAIRPSAPCTAVRLAGAACVRVLKLEVLRPPVRTLGLDVDDQEKRRKGERVKG